MVLIALVHAAALVAATRIGTFRRPAGYLVVGFSPVSDVVANAVLTIPAILTFIGVWFFRTPDHSACSACGYSRHGLPETAPCPECGTTTNRAGNASV